MICEGNLETLKLKETIKNGGRKVIVDCTSVAIFLVALNTFLSGVGTLYSDFYKTGKMPSYEVFSSAAQAFAAATSLVYMLMLTRKYRVSVPEGKKA